MCHHKEKISLMPRIKYHFRLIENLNNYVKSYSSAVEKDSELQIIHKEKLVKLLKVYQLYNYKLYH